MIAVSVQDTFIRIARLRGDALLEFHVWNRAAPDGVGDVYTGRVETREKALAGCFVALGGGLSGFLPDSVGGKTLTQGQYVTVRVSRAAQGDKGPRLDLTPAPPGAAPGLIARGPGPLADLAARYPAEEIAIDDHALLAELRPELPAARDTPRAFDPVLEDEIAALRESPAPLPHGARLHITPAPAATLLDIDAAAASAMSPLALNRAVIPELCRQIVLRNLSGGIVVDFAGLKPARRRGLLPPLAEGLKNDPLRPHLLGLSHLGFAEISRRRVRPPLHEILPP